MTGLATGQIVWRKRSGVFEVWGVSGVGQHVPQRCALVMAPVYEGLGVVAKKHRIFRYIRIPAKNHFGGTNWPKRIAVLFLWSKSMHEIERSGWDHWMKNMVFWVEWFIFNMIVPTKWRRHFLVETHAWTWEVEVGSLCEKMFAHKKMLFWVVLVGFDLCSQSDLHASHNNFGQRVVTPI